MKLQQALIPLCFVASAAGVLAAPTPGAVRVTLDGQTRIVRTIGQPTDPDFNAPLAKSLRSLWLDVRPSGSDEVEVLYQGSRIARWPLVTRVDELPTDP